MADETQVPDDPEPDKVESYEPTDIELERYLGPYDWATDEDFE